jgi:iron complex transport system permease protein
LRLEIGKSKNRLLLATVILGGSLAVAIAASLAFGAVPLTLQQIGLAILHRGDPINQTILWDLRLPRTLAAMLVGAALGMSGALLQGMLRNGLADPFLLGISAGAGLAAVTLLTLGWFVTLVPLAAWMGAILTALVVYTLARTPLGISIQRLILGGVAISSLLGAISSILLLFSDDRIQVALNWLIGSLNGKSWLEVKVVGLYIAVGLIAGCLVSRPLNLLGLGDELAVGLGVSLQRSRLLIGGIATFLAAGAVSLSGLIGFVGLVVPHIVRLLVGTEQKLVLPLSAVTGALLMVIADLIARLGAIELPVGVVTSIIGAPVFGTLLYRRSDLA